MELSSCWWHWYFRNPIHGKCPALTVCWREGKPCLPLFQGLFPSREKKGIFLLLFFLNDPWNPRLWVYDHESRNIFWMNGREVCHKLRISGYPVSPPMWGNLEENGNFSYWLPASNMPTWHPAFAGSRCPMCIWGITKLTDATSAVMDVCFLAPSHGKTQPKL